MTGRGGRTEALTGRSAAIRRRLAAAIVVGCIVMGAAWVGGVRAARGYVPHRVAPLFARPLPGEGVWRPGSYRVGGVAPVLVTWFRSDRAAPGVVAYAAWLNHVSTELALYPGTVEPPEATPRGVGAVPNGERWRLLATFNSGFKARAAAGGFAVNGRVAEPLRDGLATLIEYRDGRVDVVDWHGIPGPSKIVLARQNLPLLVEGGRPSPAAGDNLAWGAALHGAGAVWRSAVGIDRRGNLLYAAADAQTASSLAAMMVHLGAVRAMELDINPEWPSFDSYLHRGGKQPAKLVPNGQQSSLRWLVPDSRDFFAVYTRAGGGPFVPFR